MNMVGKIKLLMDERGLNKAEVSRGTDIPYTTFDGIFKKRVENVRYPTLRKLASFFDVTLEYLINDDEEDRNYGKLNPFDFTKEEHHLIWLWRQLPHDDQMKLFGRIEATLEEK